jgi:hypothetical protein
VDYLDKIIEKYSAKPTNKNTENYFFREEKTKSKKQFIQSVKTEIVCVDDEDDVDNDDYIEDEYDDDDDYDDCWD